MRAPMLLLALLGLALLPAHAEEGVVDNKDLNFQIRTPEFSIDWEVVPPTESEIKQGCGAHLNTAFADSDPPAAADLYVWVRKLSKEDVRMGLDFVGKRWKGWLETILENPRDRTEGKTTLAGVDAWHGDVTGNHATYGGLIRLQYWVALNGPHIYSIVIYRTYDAAKDVDIDDEVKEVIGSFKFHEVIKVGAHKEGGRKAEDTPPMAEGSGPKEEKIPPEKLERKELEDTFWKFKAVKPQGLLLVPIEQYSDNEKEVGVKLKMERNAGQTRCMIRVYVKSLSSGQRVYTIQELAKRYIDAYEKTYKESMRKKPEIDKRWKLGRLTDKSLAMKLVGRRTVPETTWWYLADCENDRQYQIQIYVTGGTGEQAWTPQIEDFLKNFEPLK